MDKRKKELKIKPHEIYCPNCYSIIQYDNTSTRIACPDKFKIGCKYQFMSFKTQLEADKFYNNVINIDDKYQFYQEHYQLFFVVYTYSKTAPFHLNKITDMVSYSHIELFISGLIENENSAVSFVELDKEKTNYVDIILPIKHDSILPIQCKKIMENSEDNCNMERKREFFEISKHPTQKFRFYQCVNGGIHWCYPICLNDQLYGLIIGGGFRADNDNPSIIKQAEELMYISKNKFIENKEKYKDFLVFVDESNTLDADKYVETFRSLTKNVNVLRTIVETQYAYKVHELEDKFLYEIHCILDRKYEITIDVEWFWKRMKVVMKRVCEFLELDEVAFLSNNKNIEELLIMTSSYTDRNELKEQVSLKFTKEIKAFIESKNTLFFNNHKEGHERNYSHSVLKSFREYFGLTKEREIIAISPLNISIQDEYRIGCIVFINLSETKCSFIRPDFVKRLLSEIIMILRFIYSENKRLDQLRKMDHDIIKPVNEIKTIIEYLKENIPFKWVQSFLDPGLPNLNHNLNSISRQCEIFINTTRNILISRGIYNPEYTRTMFNIKDIAWVARRLLAKEIKAKKIETDFDNIPNIVVMSDQSIIQQVFYNIFHNAVKYSYPETEIEIDLRMKEDFLTVVMTNTGIGIPEGEDEMVFRENYRATNANSIDARGTGSGLFYCKKMLEVIGGKINFLRGDVRNIITFYFSFEYK